MLWLVETTLSWAEIGQTWKGYFWLIYNKASHLNGELLRSQQKRLFLSFFSVNLRFIKDYFSNVLFIKRSLCHPFTFWGKSLAWLSSPLLSSTNMWALKMSAWNFHDPEMPRIYFCPSYGIEALFCTPARIMLRFIKMCSKPFYKLGPTLSHREQNDARKWPIASHRLSFFAFYWQILFF